MKIAYFGFTHPDKIKISQMQITDIRLVFFITVHIFDFLLSPFIVTRLGFGSTGTVSKNRKYTRDRPL